MTSIKILDAGCGNGQLVEYILSSLQKISPTTTVSIFGYDVSDGRVQEESFIIKTIARLTEQFPEIDWSSRIKIINSNDKIPFEDEAFDFIVSNQVLEHVRDPHQFFNNLAAKLKYGGFSINLFPVKEVLVDGHVKLLWAHRILSHSWLLLYISVLSKMSFGIFSKYPHGLNVSLWSEIHADYMLFSTNYQFTKTYLLLAKDNDLRIDFSYSIYFYITKFLSVIGDWRPRKYDTLRLRWLGNLTYILTKRLSSITMILERRNTHDENSGNPLL